MGRTLSRNLKEKREGGLTILRKGGSWIEGASATALRLEPGDWLRTSKRLVDGRAREISQE